MGTELLYEASEAPLAIEKVTLQALEDLHKRSLAGSSGADPQQAALAARVYDLTDFIIQAAQATPVNTGPAIGSLTIAPDIQEFASPECRDFCFAENLLVDLRKCLNTVSEIFSNVEHTWCDYTSFVEDDGEDYGHIVITLKTTCSQEVFLAEYEAWLDWMVENISEDNLDFFTLSVDRVEPANDSH